MGELSVWHWLIVAVVVLVLFGSKRLPDAARSVGRSLRIFKSEMRELSDDRAEEGGTRPRVVDGDADTAAEPTAAEPRADGSGRAEARRPTPAE